VSESKVSGGGAALGVVLSFPLAVGCVTLGQAGWLVAAAIGLVAFVMLKTESPFAKGVGAGLLIAGGIELLLVASCLAIASGIDA
jgi:hypothetical protein